MRPLVKGEVTVIIGIIAVIILVIIIILLGIDCLPVIIHDYWWSKQP